MAVQLCALLVLGGCSVKAPPRSAWTIVARAPEAGPAPTVEAGARLGVARFTSAPELRRTDLAWRGEGGLKLTSTEDRWTDYPDRMFEELVRADLLASRRFAAVSHAPPAAGLDAVLSGRLLDFTEWHEGGRVEVRVSAEWRLARPGGEPLAQGLAATSLPVAERSVAGAVRAYQAAASQVSRQLVDAVAEAARPLGVPAAPR